MKPCCIETMVLSVIATVAFIVLSTVLGDYLAYWLNGGPQKRRERLRREAAESQPMIHHANETHWRKYV